MESRHSRKQSVVFFHPYFSDGGVERTNIGLSKELIKHGYHVSFVTINPTGHFMDEIRNVGIEFVVLSAKRTLAAQPELTRWIRRKRKDSDSLVVISCQYYVNLACMLFRPFWGRHIHHILSERNHLDEFGIHRGFKFSVVKKMVRFLYPYADTIISNSKELACDLSDLTGRPVKVVYNPTVNERLYRLAEEKITEDWFNADTRPTILAIGRLSVQKDFGTLIQAFAKLHKKHNARLIILGDGPERENLQAISQQLGVVNDLLMPGFVANPYKFLKTANMFVLSSVYEGLPNVLIEALALKTPVISTLCRSGPAEILDDGRYGQLVPVGDDNALCEAMKWVFECMPEAKKKSEIAQPALKKYSPNSVGEQLVNLLSSIGS